MSSIRFFTAVALIYACGCGGSSVGKKPAAVDCSETKQADRKRVIDGLVTTKLVKRFAADGPTRMELWATQYLLARDFDDKANVCRMSFDYFACQSKGFKKVVVVDARTGKAIGQYTSDGGLELD